MQASSLLFRWGSYRRARNLWVLIVYLFFLQRPKEGADESGPLGCSSRTRSSQTFPGWWLAPLCECMRLWVPGLAGQPTGRGGMLLGSPGREGKAPQKVISANKGILSQSKAACWMTSHGIGPAITEDLIPYVHLCLPLLHTGVHHYKALMTLTEHVNGLNCLPQESETLKLLSSLPSMPSSRVSFFKIQRHSLMRFMGSKRVGQD